MTCGTTDGIECRISRQSVTAMPDVDYFQLFRWSLGTIVTIYATVITLQSLWGWYVWLAGQDKYIGLLRRYVILQGLRLRFTRFWTDALVCVLLCVAFLLMWRLHGLIEAGLL